MDQRWSLPDPGVITIAELMESKGLREQLTPVEFDYAERRLAPIADGVLWEMVTLRTTVEMDKDRSIDIWVEGVTRAWRRNTCSTALEVVLKRSLDMEDGQIRAAFEDFIRRCDYLASMYEQPVDALRRMEESLVNFVAKAATDRMKPALSF